jgi:1-deoxy-D-xylulose-5-phosphate synthase
MSGKILETLSSPEDLRTLDARSLEAVAAEIRDLIVGSTSKNGGHLASNLGAVELTIALHRVFDAAENPFFFDVGHQSYAHKILTGRKDDFALLRRFGGLSGFPDPESSVYDPAVAGHSGSALSMALGYAAANPQSKAKVIAIIGDASIANGVSLEALNSAHFGGKNLIIILNDNQMSISKNVGAISRSLSKLISGSLYNRLRGGVKKAVSGRKKILKTLQNINDVLKKALMPKATVFEELGIRYFGPVNGHSISEVESILRRISPLDGPIVLHVATRKGKGVKYAEDDPARYHGVAPFDAASGKPLQHRNPAAENNETFSEAFGRAMVELGEKNPSLYAVSAAMIEGTGLAEFRKKFPSRCFDVGICEEHAAAFTAGLCKGGATAVCAGYSSFMQRALDGIFHDAALNKCRAIFCFDRSGVVEDGPTHHGIFDCGFLRQLPGITIMAPRNGGELRKMLEFACSSRSNLPGPAVIRYPKGYGAIDSEIPDSKDSASIVRGRAELLCRGDLNHKNAIVIFAVSREIDTAFAVARLWQQKYMCRAEVVDLRFIAPVDKECIANYHSLPLVVIEDNAAAGGAGAAISEIRAAAGAKAPVLVCAWQTENAAPGFGETEKLKAAAALTPQEIFSAAEKHFSSFLN